MKNPRLFDSSAHLKSLMHALERGKNAAAYELLRRIEAQRSVIAALGKFGRGLDLKGYAAARELVPAVATRAFGSADRLETLMLRLEVDFMRAAARAQRSTSARRFDQFWEVFDELVSRRTCSTAVAAYRAAVDSGAPRPHPKLSTAKTRYGNLMDEASQRLKISG